MLTLLRVFVSILGCLAVVLAMRLLLRKAAPAPFPPGPRPLPIIGNLLDMPTSNEWLTFMKWGELYGPIVSVTLFGQRIVILNSPQASIDLLEKKGAKYAGRPYLTVATGMLGWDQALVFSPYNDHFRSVRRLLHRFIEGRTQAGRLTSVIEQETRRFLWHTLRDHDGVVDHIRKTSGTIALTISYGRAAEDRQDFLIDTIEKALKGFSSATAPGAFLADIIPILRYTPSWFPGAAWKRKVTEWRQSFQDSLHLPYDMTKEAMLNESFISPSLVATNIHTTKDPDHDYLLMCAAMSLYAGGSDTTTSAVHSFFLAMTLCPEVQKKAQAEIDAIVGSERLPTVADKENLPYTSALCSEVLRWLPVGPIGLPHRSTEDNVYDGYFVPKGAIVIANVWKFFHDPQTYSDPMAFKPERFLSEHGGTPEPDPRVFAYGFGRRICPGRYFAEDAVFASCAMTLAVFDIRKAVVDGKEITPPVEVCTGTISHPKPFSCSIKPRSAQAEALILSGSAQY